MAQQPPPFQAQRPPMQIDPNGNRSPGPRPPMGYRPTGTPPPNPAFRSAGTPPPPGSPMRPQFPPNQQGFQPPPRPSSGQNGYNGIPPNAAGVRPPFPPGMRPPMPHDRSASPQTIRPIQQGSQLPPQSPVAQAASPPANLAPTPSYSSASLPDGPQSPTGSHMSQAEHQRRKRMYPQQITQAYLDQPSPAQSYDQQYQAVQNPAASSAQYFVPGSQQQPGQLGAPVSPSAQGYGQQLQQQPGAPLPGQQQPYQAPVANMTNQFSNMSFGGGAQVKLDLCLMG